MTVFYLEPPQKTHIFIGIAVNRPRTLEELKDECYPTPNYR